MREFVSHGQATCTCTDTEGIRAEPNGFLVHLLSHSDTVSSAEAPHWLLKHSQSTFVHQPRNSNQPALQPSHPQWTRVVPPKKRIVCVPSCIKSRQHPKHFPTSPLGQYCAGSLLLNFGGQKRSGRIWPSAALGKLLKLTGQAICISRCQNRCGFGGFSMLLVVGTLCTLLWTEDCSFLNLQSTCNPRIATLYGSI